MSTLRCLVILITIVLTTITDDDRSKWSKVLASPKAFFCPVVDGFNLAVIGEGPIAPEKLAQLLDTANDKSQHRADVLTAVFVHASNTTAISTALEKASDKTTTKLDSTVGLSSLLSLIYTVELASTKPADLAHILALAREARAFLIIEATSLDQIIDCVRKIGKINQLALLNPASPKMATYFQRWTTSAVFSTKGFLPMTPSCKFEARAL